MALDKIIDSGKLDTGLSETAYTIGQFLQTIFGLSPRPTLNWSIEPQMVYYHGQPAGMPSGFAPVLFNLINQYYDPDAGIGLPADVSNVFARAKAGSFTPASDVSGTYTVAHGMGVAPDFLVVWTDALSTNDIDQIGGYLLGTYTIAAATGNANDLGNVFYGGTTATSSGSTRGTGSPGIPARPTTQNFTIQCTSSIKLKARTLYRWFAVKK